MYFTVKDKLKYSFIVRLSLIVLVTLMLPKTLFNSDIEYEVKASFFHHFSKSITWPNIEKSNNFVIGFLGDSKIFEISKNIYDNSKILNKNVILEKFNNIEKCGNCNILFISKDYSGDIAKVVTMCQKNSVLLMGESIGLGEQGVMINFYFTDKGTTAFEINPKSIMQAKLEFDLHLLNLGKVVGG